MDDISTGGWIAIIILGVLLIATNLSLVAIFRSKKPTQPGIRKTLDVMKNPWEVEDRQWERLNAAVRQLDDRLKDNNQNQ